MRVLLISSLLWLAAATADAADITPGDWRLVVATEIGEMPINLNLARVGGQWHAAFVNGPERAEAESVTVAGDKLTLAFPSYGSRIEATLGADNVISGQITLSKAKGPVVRPFTGRAGVSYRFFPPAGPVSMPFAGRWAVTDHDSEPPSRGVGVFTQTGSVVNGSILFPTEDTRYLSGDQRGDDLYLATFDGGQGSLWIAHRAADGALRGKAYFLSNGEVDDWEARRDATAQAPDTSALTYLKPGTDRLAFSFPNLDGKTVALGDPAYKGKVVIVTIGGSWCPTCHDEAAFLSPYYKANHARGLEVIGLMYEYAPEFDTASSAARKFLKRYDIQWQMLIAGVANKDSASNSLPMLNAVLAYPTMIVIDRTGKVRRITTSFPGPATGAPHEQFKRDFDALINQLLAEKS